MTIRCRNCGTEFEVTEAFFGNSQCPNCKQLVDVQARIREFDALASETEQELKDEGLL